jgi:hypothetical protein
MVERKVQESWRNASSFIKKSISENLKPENGCSFPPLHLSVAPPEFVETHLSLLKGKFLHFFQIT